MNSIKEMEMNETAESLAAGAAAGDREAFGKLYEQFFDRIYRYIYYRTLNRESAEDLCSRTFLKALDSLDSFDAGRGSFSSWLYRIAANSVTDEFRKSGRYETVTDIWDFPGSEDHTVDVHNRIYWEKLKPVFDRLPPERKEIVLLRVWDGLSFPEIAAVTGKTEAACKMSFSRTIEQLRKSVPFSMLLMFIVFKNLVL